MLLTFHISLNRHLSPLPHPNRHNDYNSPDNAPPCHAVLYISLSNRHNDYNSPGRFQNDIALVETSAPLDFDTPYVGPACLPGKGRDYRGAKDCLLSGWGYMAHYKNPNTLQVLN